MRAIAICLVMCTLTLAGHYALYKKSKGKEDEDMAEVYATLIIKGATNPKTGEAYKFADVPAVIKPKVKAVLEALDMGELAVEE